MVVSDVEPVRELCEATKSTVSYVDHRNPEALLQTIREGLQKARTVPTKPTRPTLRASSRDTSLAQWGHVAGLQLTTNH